MVRSEPGTTCNDLFQFYSIGSCLVVVFAAQEAELNQEFTTTGYTTDRLHSCDFFFHAPTQDFLFIHEMNFTRHTGGKESKAE